MRVSISSLLTLFLLSSSFAEERKPEPVVAETADVPYQLKNVELTSAGELRGQYLTPAGLPLAGKTLTVTARKQTQKIETDASGRFVVRNLKGGQCVITVDKQVFACRVWVNGTAPPSAMKSIAVVNGPEEETIRGQAFGNTVARLSSMSTGSQVGLSLLVIGGTTVAITEAAKNSSD